MLNNAFVLIKREGSGEENKQTNKKTRQINSSIQNTKFQVQRLNEISTIEIESQWDFVE